MKERHLPAGPKRTDAVRVFPTGSELRDLGSDIARSGFTAHDVQLSSLVELARRSGRAPSSVDLVIDRSVPNVVRARAFSVLIARWDDVLDGLRATPEYRAFDTAFAELLEAWNEHQRLRLEDAGPAERSASLGALDRQRLRVARSRRRLAPPADASDAVIACA